MKDRLLTNEEKLGIMDIITDGINEEFQKKYAKEKEQKIEKESNVFKIAYKRVLQLFKK